MSARRTESRPQADEGASHGDAATAVDGGRESLRRLQHGRRVELLGIELPVRMLTALGLFVVVFMAVWITLWYAFGGAGLGLGWIPAGAGAGYVALRLAGGEPLSVAADGRDPERADPPA